MIDLDFKRYTRLRDIAQKRIKRAKESGINLDIRIPTIRELRLDDDEKAAKAAYKALEDYIETGVTVKRQRQLSQTPAAKKSREYRRKRVAREYAREDKPRKYVEYVKGLDTLGVDIPPSALPAFFAYMDYRFAQGTGSKKYVFDIFVDDYMKMLKKGYNPNQILSDFQQFEADQAAIAERAEGMTGTSYEKSIALWDQFISDI